MCSDQSRAEPVRAELIGSVGQVEGRQEYLLGDVTAVALGPGDILYVADRLGSTVRAYDLEGRFLRTVGTEGDGPGEFQWPNDLTFDPAGRLYVRDANRITVLESRQPTSPADSVVRTVPLGGYANLNSTRVRTDGQIYYYPHYLFRRDEPPIPVAWWMASIGRLSSPPRAGRSHPRVVCSLPPATDTRSRSGLRKATRSHGSNMQDLRGPYRKPNTATAPMPSSLDSIPSPCPSTRSRECRTGPGRAHSPRRSPRSSPFTLVPTRTSGYVGGRLTPTRPRSTS